MNWNQSHQSPGTRVVRIDGHGSLTNANDALLATDIAVVARDPIFPRHEIKVVRFGAVRLPLLKRLLFLGEKRHLQRFNDGLRYLVLDLEDVGEVPVVAVGPDVPARAAIDELRCDPHPVPGLADAALEDMADAQLACDVANIERLPFELERRIPRDYLQRRNLR